MNDQLSKKRKLLVVLPLIALPFLTLLAWAVGLGKGSPDKLPATASGLNTRLPEARPDEGKTDKLSLYDQATKDSLQIAEYRRSDPYAVSRDSMQRVDSMSRLVPPGGYDREPGSLGSYGPYGGPAVSYNGSSATENRLRERLAGLEAQLQSADQHNASDDYAQQAMARLDAQQSMIARGTVPGTEPSAPDQDLEKIDGILEKVMDIQNPNRAREKLKAISEKHKGMVYSVSAPEETTGGDVFGNISSSGITMTKKGQQQLKAVTGGFYELPEAGDSEQQTSKAVPAVVHETQTLVTGATVKMRLTEDVFINGTLIPRGNYVFGTCDLEGERMHITVQGIRYHSQLFPVSLEVFDLDGIAGIRIPGAIGRDASKQGADQALQSLDFTTMDQSIGAQAASAGIQTVKSLFGRKAKLVRATVKAGYPVLLVDQNKRNQ